MRIDLMKATVVAAWLITLGAIALSDVVVADGSSRALLVSFGVVPMLVMSMLWASPEASLSESIAKARG
jgi:hypothetical protein